MAKTSSYSKHDKAVVHAAYGAVMRRIEGRAPRCLSRTVRIVTTNYNPYGGYSTSVTYRYFTPTVRIGRRRGEVYMQMNMSNLLGVKNRKQVPKAGWYILIADIYPEGLQRTKIDVTRGRGEKLVSEAIRNWAAGTNMGCPNMVHVY